MLQLRKKIPETQFCVYCGMEAAHSQRIADARRVERDG